MPSNISIFVKILKLQYLLKVLKLWQYFGKIQFLGIEILAKLAEILTKLSVPQH